MLSEDKHYKDISDWELILELRLTDAEIDLREKLPPHSVEKKIELRYLKSLREQMRKELDVR